jgi:acetyl-CoA carboxylase biotin carboxyl carrier protein
MDEQEAITTPGGDQLQKGGGARRRFQRAKHRREPQGDQAGAGPAPVINMAELRELVGLIATHGFTEFELEQEGFRVRLRRELASLQTSAPASQTGIAAPLPPNSGPVATVEVEREPRGDEQPEEKLHIITSPIVGTFYRAPSPTAEPYVKVGSHVEPETVVCIIEAMKLMNEIKAEVSGTVEKIYVENAQPVEYGQPLFGIRLD